MSLAALRVAESAGSGIRFDATVPFGNGQRFEHLGGDTYRCHIRVASEPFAQLFHFEIRSESTPRQLRLQIVDGIAWGSPCYAYSWYQPMLSHDDGKTWESIPDCQARLISTGEGVEDQAMEYAFTLSGSPVRFSSVIPHSLERLGSWLERLQDRHGDVLELDVAGKSVEGRSIPVLRFTDPEVLDCKKARVFLLSGQHPAETEPRLVLEELVELALRTPELLRQFVFEVIPILNVDGVAHGRSYSNVHDVNLSTAWEDQNEPEILAACDRVREFRPDVFVDMHSGDFPDVARFYCAMSEAEQLALERDAQHAFREITFGHTHSIRDRAVDFLVRNGWVGRGFVLEVPRFPNDVKWYQRQAAEVLTLITRFSGRFVPEAESVVTPGIRLRFADFVAALPVSYVTGDLNDLRTTQQHFEVNGLPLPAKGHYAVCLQDVEHSGTGLQVSADGRAWVAPERIEEGWRLFGDIPIPGRKLAFYVRGDKRLPDDATLLIRPSHAYPQDVALEEFAEYKRETLLEQRPIFREWPTARAAILATDIPLTELRRMFMAMTDWSAARQVLDDSDPHHGGIYSEEDKYSFRDAACAAVAFMLRSRMDSEEDWPLRARLAIDYCLKAQQFAADPHIMGGFPEMGMLDDSAGARYRRITDPPSIVTGVDTGLIGWHLVRAFELGVELQDRDVDALRHIGVWMENSELRMGQFRHHHGAVTDCQNSDVIAAATMSRIADFFSSRGIMPSGRWLGCSKRALVHALTGQEGIGEWPYLFATIGGRGHAYHWQSVPDQGMLLRNLLECDRHPAFRELIDASGCLGRIAHWYLLTSRFTEDGTITLDYEEEPGDGVGFNAFTWCRFMGCASIAQIRQRIGNAPFWRHFVLSQMKFVRDNLWNDTDPERGPVRASVVPLKLHSWIQANEWNAVLLHEIMEALGEPTQGICQVRHARRMTNTYS